MKKVEKDLEKVTGGVRNLDGYKFEGKVGTYELAYPEYYYVVSKASNYYVYGQYLESYDKSKVCGNEKIYKFNVETSYLNGVATSQNEKRMEFGENDYEVYRSRIKL